MTTTEESCSIFVPSICPKTTEPIHIAVYSLFFGGGISMPLEPKVMWDKVKKSIKGKSNEEQIIILESYLSEWPQFRGPYMDMKMKIKKMLENLRRIQQIKSKSKKEREDGQLFSVKKQGVARIALLGLPNAGKSTVFTNLTKRDVPIGDYPYTTQDVNTGIYEFNNISIQLLDLPPIAENTISHLSYGANLFNCIKSVTEIVCLVVDCSKDIGRQIMVILNELEQNQISLFNSYRVDYGEKQATLKKGIVLLTKTDLSPRYQITEEGQGMLHNLKTCSIHTQEQLTYFQNVICELLGMITVFCRIPHSGDLNPFSIYEGTSVYDLANNIHKELAKHFKCAKIWGDSAKFPGQRVHKDHVLYNQDIVEIYT